MMRDIVIVEDNLQEIDLVRETFALVEVEFRLHVAVDGDQGMALIDRLGVDIPIPHLVILDLNLPGHCGLEILDRLRARDILAKVPVIIRSGSLNPRERESSMTKGANLFMSKPYDLDGFLEQAKIMKALMAKGDPT